MNVLQSNPGAAYMAIKPEIDSAIVTALNSGWYILGEQVKNFENNFAAFNGANYAVGVANGTDAIEIALRALDIARGDKVVTVAHTAVATVAAIERAGAVPVFVDIHPGSFTMNPERLQQLLAADKDKQIKAVVPVHLYGHPADMDAILKIAAEYNLSVVEDCAQAHGAAINGKLVGTFGDIGAFSFYPTKNLGAMGDGGAVITNSESISNRLRALRQYGWEERYISSSAGINSRLDELQAAILNVKLKYLGAANRRRQEIAAQYDAGLADLNIITPIISSGCAHVYHQYVIRTECREELMYYLKQHGVATAIHYPVPVHRQPAYAARLQPQSLPVTEGIADSILSLPMFPELNDVEVEYVISTVKAFGDK
jgi:dTDP-4-amino-4,6-dideoxygalactose transaminase